MLNFKSSQVIKYYVMFVFLFVKTVCYHNEFKRVGIVGERCIKLGMPMCLHSTAYIDLIICFQVLKY